VARGINVWRDTGHGWVAFGPEALDAAAQAALLRYLAVAHFGRGRGRFEAESEPEAWREEVAAALASRRERLARLWKQAAGRTTSERTGLASGLRDLLTSTATSVLSSALPDRPAVPP
jgi:hypothetical protein